MTELNHVVATLQRGGVIAYPTEAVFGLGCDPCNKQAVLKILELKQRPVEKGLILIAASARQLSQFIEEETLHSFPHVLASWPGPNTWLLPCKKDTPAWLTGEFDTLAVRVTAHSLAASICKEFGRPLVSTSANPANMPPAKTASEVEAYFGDKVDLLIDGPVNVDASVSSIRDARTNRQLR